MNFLIALENWSWDSLWDQDVNAIGNFLNLKFGKYINFAIGNGANFQSQFEESNSPVKVKVNIFEVTNKVVIENYLWNITDLYAYNKRNFLSLWPVDGRIYFFF